MHRRLRIALATFLIAGTVMSAIALYQVRRRLFMSAEKRAGEAFAACLFADAKGCAELVPAHLDGCAQGLADHCHEAAQLFVAGKIVGKDPTRGLELFRRGCELGRGGSCFAVGRMLREGIGVPVDLAGALAAYRAACEIGEWGACQRVALLLLSPNASGAAWKEAEVALSNACKHGVALACYNQLVASRHVDGNTAFASQTLSRVCRATPLSCDVAALPLEQPDPGYGVDEKIFQKVCQQCGGPGPGSAVPTIR